MYENYEVMKLQTWIDMFDPDEINVDKIQEYLDFIKEAIDRYDSTRYSEWHHVIPRCLDKNHTYDNEGVRINGSDHFRAHMKLVECFNGIKKRSLSCALIRMKRYDKDILTPEEWEEAKKLYSESITGELNPMYQKSPFSNMTPEKYEEYCFKLSERVSGSKNPMYGKRHSEEAREKISKATSGENNPFYKREHSEETKRIISEGRTGDKNPAYNKIWITNYEIDKRVSQEDFENVYKQQGFVTGRKVSQETRNKMRESSNNRSRDKKGRWS